MRQQSMTRPRSLTSQDGGSKAGGSKAGGARPLSPGAAALGRAAARGCWPPTTSRSAWRPRPPCWSAARTAAPAYSPCRPGRSSPNAAITCCCRACAARSGPAGTSSRCGTRSPTGRTRWRGCASRAGSRAGWPPTAPVTSASCSGHWPWTRHRNWSPPWCTSARTTSTGPGTTTAPSICTTTSCGVTWSRTRRAPGCCARWHACSRPNGGCATC